MRKKNYISSDNIFLCTGELYAECYAPNLELMEMSLIHYTEDEIDEMAETGDYRFYVYE